ncbi:MAG: hypothetical protein J3Q66DRAFT_172883 [Benniella sp.]|nr:MAG: hypothetical protein J3Q66DRAFT_172883 [Benniella sp.]
MKLKQDKLGCSEGLGTIVYLRADAPNKVIAWFTGAKQYSVINLYTEKVGYTLDYAVLFELSMFMNLRTIQSSQTCCQQRKGRLVDSQKVDSQCFHENEAKSTQYLLM